MEIFNMEKCKICEYIFASRNDMVAHMEIEHKIKPNNENYYICEICGKKGYNIQAYLTHMGKGHGLLKKDVYDKFHRCESDGLCKICEEPTKWAPPKIRLWGYDTLCKKHRRKETTRLRKETCKNKYGVESVSQLESSKLKRKKTCLERYGVENLMTLPEHRAKIEKTCLERYGVKSASSLNSFKEKIKNTCMNRYSVQNGSQHHINQEAISILNNSEKLSEFYDLSGSGAEIAKKIGVSIKTVYDYLHKHNIKIQPSNSSEERFIYPLLKECDIEYETNVRTIISPKEIDIYLPDHNLAIEYNGLYWHVEQRGKDRNYHLNKTRRCEEQRIQLLHIFSSDDLEIWKSVILSKLGIVKKIGARKTEVVKLSSKEANQFCQENHLQGTVNASLRLGLTCAGDLVSIMTFGKSRFNKKYQWELLRFCSKKGYQVIGGASKLFKHSGVKSCISYANRRWSCGKLYEAIGFEKIGESQPNYFYTRDYKTLFNRMKFQKHKLSGLIGDFDPNLSEYQNMVNNNYDRIWDCGNLIYGYEY